MKNHFLPGDKADRHDDPSEFDMPGTEDRDDNDDNNTLRNDDDTASAPESGTL